VNLIINLQRGSYIRGCCRHGKTYLPRGVVW